MSAFCGLVFSITKGDTGDTGMRRHEETNRRATGYSRAEQGQRNLTDLPESLSKAKHPKQHV